MRGKIYSHETAYLQYCKHKRGGKVDMKNQLFSDQFDEEAIERKQDLRRKRFLKRMERKLWLKQYARSSQGHRSSKKFSMH